MWAEAGNEETSERLSNFFAQHNYHLYAMRQRYGGPKLPKDLRDQVGGM